MPVATGFSRRGLTLVELLIGLVLAVTVAGVAQGLLVANLRVARAQAERIQLQDNLRTGALIVAGELRGLGFESDIVAGEPGRIRYRGTRGTGFTCAPPVADRVLLRAGTWIGPRQPAAGVDSVALFVEGDPALADDDAWVRARVAGVSGGVCADGAPAIALDLAWEQPAFGAAEAARMMVGGPAAIFEVLELRYYPQDGRYWLGMRSVSRGELIQPLLGPLADSSAAGRGLTLEYLDRDDFPTADMSEVRAIGIRLRGVTDRPGVPADSLALSTRVALRNTLRP